MKWLGSIFLIALILTPLGLVWSRGLQLSPPFGPVEDLIRHQNPWYGFDAQGPVLWIVRIQEIHTKKCREWMKALLHDTDGIPAKFPVLLKERDAIWKAWKPWEIEDLNAIEECKDFPCDVKFNSAEVSEMAKVDQKSRLDKYLNLVEKRASNYLLTQNRVEYEFPGNPIDPWPLFVKRGFIFSQPLPKVPELWVRKLDFAPGKILALHQILDRRAMMDPEKGATVWIRDAYTDHYFDSWGEWENITCQSSSPPSLILTQVLLVEFDLLKKTDIFSRLMRGKMRSAIEENGKIYLNDVYKRLDQRLQ